jgi:hypothetical protein
MLQRILDTKSVMWWTWRRLNPDARHLPVIVPVVVYNGRRPWRAPTNMHALYALPDELRASLGPHVLSYSFVLDDLCAATDESLRSRRMDEYARLCLFAMARASSPTFSIASLPGEPSCGAPSAPAPPSGSSHSCSILIVCIAILTRHHPRAHRGRGRPGTRGSHAERLRSAH